LNRYNPESVHKRVDYIRFNYKNKDFPNNFENFVYPIVLYDRSGIITDANKAFRFLTRITQDDILNGAVNIFYHLSANQKGLSETARNAYDGKEIVYIGSGCLIQISDDNPNRYELSSHPNAIFFPMEQGVGNVKLVGMLLDENKTD